MNERALNIAAKARLYRLLAGRHELNTRDRGERIDRTTADVTPLPMPLLDSTLVEHATELDLMCGYAVRVLSSGGHGRKPVLDVLGALEADTICAVYRALPPGVQRAINKTDGTWNYALHHEPEGVDEAADALAELDACVGRNEPGLVRVDREGRRLRAGLSHGLSAEEVNEEQAAMKATRVLVRRVGEAGPDADVETIVNEWAEECLPTRAA